MDQSIRSTVSRKKQQLALPGGEFLSHSAAGALTNDFQLETDGVRSHLFGGRLITELINRPDCVGMLVYHGLHKQGLHKSFHALVLVGIDNSGEILDDRILELSSLCPPVCPEIFTAEEPELLTNIWENTGEFISRELANGITDNFTYQIDGNNRYFYSRKEINAILNQPHCQGIRFHHGEDKGGQHQLLLTGVNRENKFLFPIRFLKSNVVNPDGIDL